MVNISLFNRLVPLKALLPADRTQLAKQSSVLQYQPGQAMFRDGELARTHAYLIEGSVELTNDQGLRVLHAEDIGVGIARAIRAAVSGRPGGVYLDFPAKIFGQVMDGAAGQRSLIKVVDAAPRQIPAPDAVQRALDVLKGAKRPLILLGKGAAYAQADGEAV